MRFELIYHKFVSIGVYVNTVDIRNTVRKTPVTAHPHDQHDNEADTFDAVPNRSGRMRRAFKPVVQVGWNIASYCLGREDQGSARYCAFQRF